MPAKKKLNPSYRSHHSGKARAPSCPYRVKHRLYEVWQRSDPLCDVSEAL